MVSSLDDGSLNADLNSGLTKTYATVVFKPSQIRWSKDIPANGEPENAEYRDRSLREKCVSDHHDIVKSQVMNDVSRKRRYCREY